MLLRKGESAIKEVNSFTVRDSGDAGLELRGDHGELEKIQDYVKEMIEGLGSGAEAKSAHYMCGGAGVAVFLMVASNRSEGQIEEISSSERLMEVIVDNNLHKKKPVKLQLSTPCSSEHPFAVASVDDGTWDGVQHSSSQPDQAREAEYRPPKIMDAEQRGALRAKRGADSSKRMQILANLKQMCLSAKAAQVDGLLDLKPPHCRAIADLILEDVDKMAGGGPGFLFQELSYGDTWKESYIQRLPWNPSDVDDDYPISSRVTHNRLIAALCACSSDMAGAHVPTCL